jgi:stress-induced morphogen
VTSAAITRERVEARLRERLAPLAPGSHFRVQIVSTRFAGLSRVAAQRLVYEALGEWMGGLIHACAVSARAPMTTRRP